MSAPSEKPLRVVQWGTGETGRHALRFLVEDPGFDVIGVVCFTPAKEGQDAGVLAGLDPIGVLATTDADDVLALDADCVLFMPRDTFLDPTLPDSPSGAWVDDVVRILERGSNVVSPLQSAMHWRQLADGEALRVRFEEACRRGGSSLFFTGLDPGFVSDCLSTTLSSASARVRQVRTLEVIDYATYGAAETLESMGFGQPDPGDDQAGAESLLPSWGGALWLVADALGVELDELRLSSKTWATPESFTSPGGLRVERGTTAGLQWTLCGLVGDEVLVECRHVSRVGEDAAPDWPRIGKAGGYAVEVDGDPPLRLDLPLGLPGGTGTCLGDAVVMTAARCVNAVATVVAAPPGYHLLHRLPVFGGRAEPRT